MDTAYTPSICWARHSLNKGPQLDLAGPGVRTALHDGALLLQLAASRGDTPPCTVAAGALIAEPAPTTVGLTVAVQRISHWLPVIPAAAADHTIVIGILAAAGLWGRIGLGGARVLGRVMDCLIIQPNFFRRTFSFAAKATGPERPMGM